MVRSTIQTALRGVYPTRCLICGTVVAEDAGLCTSCWRDVPFLGGLTCDLCGAPLPGHSNRAELCDECLATPRPWQKGRAAILYQGEGKRLVMALKHGDRQDIAPVAAGWMTKVGRPLLQRDTLIAPVPLHWRRLLQRRFNQAALLSRELARHTGHTHSPDLLIRLRHTPSTRGQGRAARFQQMENAFALNPKNRISLRGRPVLIIDDVMTTGATLAAVAQICHDAGASHLSVLLLARAQKAAYITEIE